MGLLQAMIMENAWVFQRFRVVAQVVSQGIHLLEIIIESSASSSGFSKVLG